MQPSLIHLIQQRICNQWQSKALSDYQGDTFTYAEVAHAISYCHNLFRQYGIERGDRVALCGEGSARWAIAFMAVTTYGAVPVPILTTFTPAQIQNIITHSESRLLFASRTISQTLDDGSMPLLEQRYIIDNLRAPVSLKFKPEDINYTPESSPEDMAMINYTSGTTGNSKGVVLPYRAFLGNYNGFQKDFGKLMKPGTPHLSILPLAHMYGLTLELICPFLRGCHVTFLRQPPSPTVLTCALSDVRPHVVMAVPLVIEKLTKQTIRPIIKKSGMEKAVKWPVLGYVLRQYLHRKLIKAFGGRVKYIITGGAAINPTVAQQLLAVHIPLAEAYGATECAPGEILTRGTNTMLGYFKNPEATAEALDADGWYHTGDNGVIDANGYLYIKGRKKNMLLGPNGQNIYPEEIEHSLNNMLMVQESIVIQRKPGELVALVYPDYNEARELGLTEDNISNIMKLNAVDINELIPAYERIHHIEISENEFEKTAKRTIKRYLYK